MPTVGGGLSFDQDVCCSKKDTGSDGIHVTPADRAAVQHTSLGCYRRVLLEQIELPEVPSERLGSIRVAENAPRPP